MNLILPKFLNDLEAEELIWGPPEVILTDADLRSYQRWMSEKIIELPGVYLGAEMGLGKTGATLRAVVDLLDAGEVKNVLIIAPLFVAEETWVEEIAKWEFARHLRYRVVTGDYEQRVAALKHGPAEITIINRENLLWLLRMLGFRRWKFDMIVYDEASRMKRGVLRTNPKPRADGTVAKPRLTEMGVISSVRNVTKKIVELSGTPSPNGLIDLYGPITAMDGGVRLGKSMNAYKLRWFREDRYTRKIDPLPGAHEEIMAAIDDVFFSLKSEDYLKLPKLVEVTHDVRLPPDAKAKYDEMEREAELEIARENEDPEVIEAVNNGVLAGKLLQLANGSIYGEGKKDFPVHMAKLDVLESIVEEAAGRPVLVAYSFEFDKNAILKRFGKRARVFGTGKNDKRDWNAGRIPLMLLHPASAGHGLNFQFGSNIAVWYGLTWSLELFLQFLKRLWRSGQKEDRVFLHYILARGTADYDVKAALTTKGATQDSITDAVRVRLTT